MSDKQSKIEKARDSQQNNEEEARNCWAELIVRDPIVHGLDSIDGLWEQVKRAEVKSVVDGVAVVCLTKDMTSGQFAQKVLGRWWRNDKELAWATDRMLDYLRSWDD